MSRLVLALLGFVFALALEAPACELQAELVSPQPDRLSGGDSIQWTVEFRNAGKQPCKGNTVTWMRTRGKSSGGAALMVGGSRGRKKLPALPPGAAQRLGFSEARAPASGSYTYTLKYARGHNDKNPKNHQVRKTVTFERKPAGSAKQKNPGLQTARERREKTREAAKERLRQETVRKLEARKKQEEARQKQLEERAKRLAALEEERKKRELAESRRKAEEKRAEQKKAPVQPRASSTPAFAAVSPCDLVAAFVGPEQSTLPGERPIDWQIRFRNEGGEACKSNRVQLARTSGRSSSGSASFVGGTRNRVELPSLAPEAEVTLTIRDARPPETGEHTYAVRYSSPNNDANNRNHQVSRTVRFEGPSPVAAPGQCDLRVTQMKPQGNQLRGGEWKHWEFVFTNSGNAACEANTVYLARFQLDSRDRRPTEVGGANARQALRALDRNESQTLEFEERDTPVIGNYQYQLGYVKRHRDRDDSNHALVTQVSYSGAMQAFNAPLPVPLSITVRDQSGGLAVGASVCAFSDPSKTEQVGPTMQTQANGIATLVVPPGSVTGFAYHEGVIRTRENIFVSDSGGSSDITLIANGPNACGDVSSDPGGDDPGLGGMEISDNRGDGGIPPGLANVRRPPARVDRDSIVLPETYSGSNQRLQMDVTWSPVADATHYRVSLEYRGGGRGATDRGEPLNRSVQPGNPSVSGTSASYTENDPPANLALAHWAISSCKGAACGPPISAYAYVRLDGGTPPPPPPVADASTWEVIRPAFQSPSCTNCHAVASDTIDAVRLVIPDHPTNTSPDCAGCHNDARVRARLPANLSQILTENGVSGSLLGIEWHVPGSNMDFRSAGSSQLCGMAAVGPPSAFGSALDHLTRDPLILWAVSGGNYPSVGNSGNLGGRAPSAFPAGVEAWIVAVKAWVDAGSPCP